MLASLLSAAFAAAPSPLPSSEPNPPTPVTAAAAAPATIRAEKALKALSTWLKAYRSGKVNLLSDKFINRAPVLVDWKDAEIEPKQSFAVRAGLVEKDGLDVWTAREDFVVIMDAAGKLETAEAAALLVEVAALGFAQEEYKRAQEVHFVRDLGMKKVEALASTAARKEVARIAAGEARLNKKREIAMRGVALRALAAYGQDHVATLTAQILHEDPLLRFHAAEALARVGGEPAAEALIIALGKESTEVAMPAMVEALRTIYASYRTQDTGGDAGGDDKDKDDKDKTGDDGAEGGDTPAAAPAVKLPPSARQAVKVAIGAIGRTSWRGDMALLRLLDDLRSKDAVPALIKILARYQQNPDLVKSGQLSGLVLHRAHELLMTMTGAVYPVDQVAQWQEFWQKEKDKVDIQKRHAAEGAQRTAGFCGIPVEGSRVVFILDLSRSMTFAMQRDGDGGATRMDFARRELERAMNEISDQSAFNLITFNGDDEAEVWSRKLLPATPKNREKFIKYLGKLEPDGGTNLWSAIEEALTVSRLTYAENYEKVIDEIFILSDGAPSVGEVVDPVEILRLVKEANRFAKVRINTVFINSKDPEEFRRQRTPWMGDIKPQELMRRLAEENGGRCVIL